MDWQRLSRRIDWVRPCYAKNIWPEWLYFLIKHYWLDRDDALRLWMANLHTRCYPDPRPDPQWD